jgi:hypothetical protein
MADLLQRPLLKEEAPSTADLDVTLEHARAQFLRHLVPCLLSGNVWSVAIAYLNVVDEAEFRRRRVFLAWPSIPELKVATRIRHAQNIEACRKQLRKLGLFVPVGGMGPRTGRHAINAYMLNWRCIPNNAWRLPELTLDQIVKHETGKPCDYYCRKKSEAHPHKPRPGASERRRGKARARQYLG